MQARALTSDETFAGFRDWSYSYGRVGSDGRKFMHLIAMKILGSVFRLDDTPWDYHDRLRPSAQGIEGFATCEIVLSNPTAMITKKPQPAELHFHRIVKLPDAAEEIDLYDGPRLILKFRPVTLPDAQATETNA